MKKSWAVAGDLRMALLDAEIDPANVVQLIGAWDEGGDPSADYNYFGGFVFRLKDGRFVYLEYTLDDDGLNLYTDINFAASEDRLELYSIAKTNINTEKIEWDRDPEEMLHALAELKRLCLSPAF